MADVDAATALVEGLAVAAATNPTRIWAALPSPPARVLASAVGAAATVIAAAALAALATPLLDVLEISASTLRVGTGIVIAVVGLYDLVARPPRPEPALAGWKAGLVPLAFPLLINPAFGGAAITAGADHGIAVPVVAAIVGTGVLVALAATTIPTLRVELALGALGRTTGAVLIVLGIALAVDGVFSL
jgi:small neutral amino acid transporter SnatA (MarC family)